MHLLHDTPLCLGLIEEQRGKQPAKNRVVPSLTVSLQVAQKGKGPRRKDQRPGWKGPVSGRVYGKFHPKTKGWRWNTEIRSPLTRMTTKLTSLGESRGDRQGMTASLDGVLS